MANDHAVVRPDALRELIVKWREKARAIRQFVADNPAMAGTPFSNGMLAEAQTLDEHADELEAALDPVDPVDPRPYVQQIRELTRYQEHDVVRRPSTAEYVNADDLDEILKAIDAALAGVPQPQEEKQVGFLYVDIYTGIREHHISGPIGMYPRGVDEVIAEVHRVLDLNEQRTPAASPSRGVPDPTPEG